ncbi:ABC1 kinase family protein [Amycolatopsis anabasis]|uniref:ABC1 kinase family protein n=1 Tax=Amycolatopsis anabasis TaxID=1840409 RepID=UPI00131AC1E2|nr:AarF/UbiB family protein [Amycolatopsis anabasis]
MTNPGIGTGAVILRLVRTLAVLTGRALPLGWLLVTGRARSGAWDAWLADTVVALGPAFVKAAQLLSTRADLLPPRACRALARLHDRVRPIPPRSSAALAAFPGTEARLVGAGSIACVYRVRLDDRVVAVKVRRPGIDRALNLDLALFERLAALVAKAPVLRGVPVAEIADQLAASIRAQLDLAAEAESLDGFRRTVASLPGVTVPEADRALSTEDILVMDFLDDLTRRRPAELAEPDRHRAVVTALRAVYRMLFLDGVVHCDLHPGNLYFRPDGTIVILDAGFTVRLTDSAREKFAAFFYCMGQGDGEACADIVLSTARSVPGADAEGFRAELAALVAAHTGRPAAEFDLVSFATALFDVQRRYGFAADPQFVFPILSLLVLEGTVREFHPGVDFQRVAKPFLVSALFERALVPTEEVR